MYDEDGQVAMRYVLQNAWPVSIVLRIEGSGTTRRVIEDVTLVCDSMQQVAGA